MNSYLRPDENFAPTSGTRNQWLHTPKKQKTIAGITIYGLFETYRFDLCITALLAIIVAEAIAFGIFYSEADNINTIIIVLAAMILDFILALLSHKDQDKICLINNLITLENDVRKKQSLQNGPIDSQNPLYGIKKSLKYYNRIKITYRVFIAFLAVVKIGAFAAFHEGDNGNIDGIFVFVTALYSIAAYLHIMFTGYLYYVWTFHRNVKREHDRYVSSGGDLYSYDVNDPLSSVIETTTELNIVRQGDQEIIRDANKPNTYRLITLGILTDTELNYLVSRQDNSEQKGIVLRVGIRHQIEQLSQNPLRQ